MTFKLIGSTIVIIVLSALVVIYSPVDAAHDAGAKIAVAAESGSADATISRFAARSPYFLLFDEQGNLVEAVENPYYHEQHRAGPQVVEFLSGKGIHTVIAGEFGGKMLNAMKQKNMVFKPESGRAADAVRRLLKP